MNRLTYRGEGGYVCVKGCIGVYGPSERPKAYLNNAVIRLAAYEDAEEDGRLILPPCKVGDTIYELFLGCVMERTVACIIIQRSFMVIYCSGSSRSFGPDDFGKTVFNTREEAEAAQRRANQ